MKVLKHQLLMYEDLEPNTTFLHDYTKRGNTIDLGECFTRDNEGEIRFAFGKHHGRLAKEHIGYLEWMVGNDFAIDTKLSAQKIIDHAKWEQASLAWLQKEEILIDQSLMAALYTCLKFKQEIRPFKMGRQGNKVLLCYNKEVPSFFLLDCADHKSTLLNILEKHMQREGA